MIKVLSSLLLLTVLSKAYPNGEISVQGSGGAAGKGGSDGRLVERETRKGEEATHKSGNVGVDSAAYILKHAQQAPHVVEETMAGIKVPVLSLQPVKNTITEKSVMPSYIEKGVRRYVENARKVPAVPNIVEKKISQGEIPDHSHHVKVEEHPHVGTAQKLRDSNQNGGGYEGANSGVFDVGGRGKIGHSDEGRGEGLFGNKEASVVGPGGSGKELFNTIFEIPIQTLGAVNVLLNNIHG